jgi:uncharacterized RDD family membrane protein YckC
VAVRTVLRVIDGLFLYLVGLVVMLVTGERRGRLGDLAAGTMIVSADAGPPPVPAIAPAASATITLPTAEPERPARRSSRSWRSSPTRYRRSIW